MTEPLQRLRRHLRAVAASSALLALAAGIPGAAFAQAGATTAPSSTASKPPSDTPSAWTPAVARRMAEIAVQMVKDRADLTLDYSPQSLRTIDQIVLKAREQGHSAQSMERTLLVLGCYVGEVMVRNIPGASWEVPSGAERAVLGDLPIGVRSANGLTNPIGKTYKLMLNGAEDSTYGLYQLIADPKFRDRAKASIEQGADKR